MIYFREILDDPLRHLVVRINHKQHSYTPARGTGSSSGGAICNPQRRSAPGGGRWRDPRYQQPRRRVALVKSGVRVEPGCCRYWSCYYWSIDQSLSFLPRLAVDLCFQRLRRLFGLQDRGGRSVCLSWISWSMADINIKRNIVHFVRFRSFVLYYILLTGHIIVNAMNWKQSFQKVAIVDIHVYTRFSLNIQRVTVSWVVIIYLQYAVFIHI